MAHGGHETEIKLAVSDAKSARRRLRAAGFAIVKRRVFEVNLVYDDAALSLGMSSRLLRIRTAGGHAKLTYKGPPSPGKHKSREELEVDVSDSAVLGTVLEQLGFQLRFRYEKYRTELAQPNSRGVATVDETPVGVYLELEGSPRWIDRTARRLGYRESDYITVSYGRLYLEWCTEHGVEPSHMVFQ